MLSRPALMCNLTCSPRTAQCDAATPSVGQCATAALLCMSGPAAMPRLCTQICFGAWPCVPTCHDGCSMSLSSLTARCDSDHARDHMHAYMHAWARACVQARCILPGQARLVAQLHAGRHVHAGAHKLRCARVMHACLLPPVLSAAAQWQARSSAQNAARIPHSPITVAV